MSAPDTNPYCDLPSEYRHRLSLGWLDRDLYSFEGVFGRCWSPDPLVAEDPCLWLPPIHEMLTVVNRTGIWLYRCRPVVLPESASLRWVW